MLTYMYFVYVQEKEKALISDDYGKDLASVQALQRKYEGFVVSVSPVNRSINFCVMLTSV